MVLRRELALLAELAARSRRMLPRAKTKSRPGVSSPPISGDLEMRSSWARRLVQGCSVVEAQVAGILSRPSIAPREVMREISSQVACAAGSCLRAESASVIFSRMEVRRIIFLSVRARRSSTVEMATTSRAESDDTRGQYLAKQKPRVAKMTPMIALLMVFPMIEESVGKVRRLRGN